MGSQQCFRVPDGLRPWERAIARSIESDLPEAVTDCSWRELSLGNPFSFVSMQGTCYYLLSKADTRLVADFFATPGLKISNQQFAEGACALRGPEIERDVLSDADFVRYVGNFECVDFIKTIRGDVRRRSAEAKLANECLAVKVWIGIYSAVGASGDPWQVVLSWDRRGGSSCV